MSEEKFSAERFESHREHLRAVAYRMLGSLADAEDAVQETWIKASRADTSGVENPAGWLTTVVGRVCLDMLRSRKSRREDSWEGRSAEPVVILRRRVDPEEEALLSDSVGLALLVVLDTLTPPERLAFVLHDLFSVPFAQIAPIVERSPGATQRLASRARQRVRGGATPPDADRERRHRAVDAFLTAARNGEFAALLSMLDPNVTVRMDDAAQRLGGVERSGAHAVAEAFNGEAQAARPVLVNGEVGAVVAPRGRLLLVFELRFVAGRITQITAIADRDRLAAMELALP